MSDQSDREEEAFELFRDKVLLFIGTLGVLSIAGAAIFTTIKNPEIALAALTVFGGLLGAPTILRIDGRRAQRKRESEKSEK